MWSTWKRLCLTGVVLTMTAMAGAQEQLPYKNPALPVDDLAYRAYRAISDEAMAVNIRHHYSPCLYFCRDPRWGRMEETYGEDPLMVTRFGLAFVKAIRDAGGVPTLKGYPYNYGEGGHDSFPAYVSEREFRQFWLVLWEAAVKKYGDVMAIMPAYSTINDIPVHANPWQVKGMGLRPRLPLAMFSTGIFLYPNDTDFPVSRQGILAENAIGRCGPSI